MVHCEHALLPVRSCWSKHDAQLDKTCEGMSISNINVVLQRFRTQEYIYKRNSVNRSVSTFSKFFKCGNYHLFGKDISKHTSFTTPKPSIGPFP